MDDQTIDQVTEANSFIRMHGTTDLKIQELGWALRSAVGHIPGSTMVYRLLLRLNARLGGRDALGVSAAVYQATSLYG